ncbi:cytochrome b5-like heme/steroid binding domain-containing protein [Aspergillus heterothallicus]
MGWLTLRRRAEAQSTSEPVHSSSEKIGAYAEHTEDIANPLPSPQPQHNPTKTQPRTFLGSRYPLVDLSTPDTSLPYINPETVTHLETHYKSSPASIPAWIVIDNIVYDCTDFLNGHPGGSVVINSFVGQDCSWQFWRFHGRQHMHDFGRALRVGRTEGVRNRFKEPARYVGLGALDEGW